MNKNHPRCRKYQVSSCHNGWERVYIIHYGKDDKLRQHLMKHVINRDEAPVWAEIMDEGDVSESLRNILNGVRCEWIPGAGNKPDCLICRKSTYDRFQRCGEKSYNYEKRYLDVLGEALEESLGGRPLHVHYISSRDSSGRLDAVCMKFPVQIKADRLAGDVFNIMTGYVPKDRYSNKIIRNMESLAIKLAGELKKDWSHSIVCCGIRMIRCINLKPADILAEMEEEEAEGKYGAIP